MSQVMQDFRLQLDPYDKWGSAMGFYFDCCTELTHRGVEVPAVHQFRTGAMGPYSRKEYSHVFLWDAETADILRSVEVMRRYTDILRAADLDY